MCRSANCNKPTCNPALRDRGAPSDPRSWQKKRHHYLGPYCISYCISYMRLESKSRRRYRQPSSIGPAERRRDRPHAASWLHATALARAKRWSGALISALRGSVIFLRQACNHRGSPVYRLIPFGLFSRTVQCTLHTVSRSRQPVTPDLHRRYRQLASYSRGCLANTSHT